MGRAAHRTLSSMGPRQQLIADLHTPFRVAVTGGVASGKTTVCELFGRYQIPTIDADQIARQLVEPGSTALQCITEHFGHRVLSSNGALDRRQLRSLIFSSPDERQWLEALLHPLIRTEMIQQSQQQQAPYLLLAIPLLVESGWYQLTDHILVIDTPTTIQIERLQQRDQTTLEQAHRLLAAQASAAERLAHADSVIHNSGTISDLLPQISLLHHNFTQYAQTKTTALSSAASADTTLP